MKNIFFMFDSKEQVKTRTHILFKREGMKCHCRWNVLMKFEMKWFNDKKQMWGWWVDDDGMWQRQNGWLDIYRQTNDQLFSKNKCYARWHDVSKKAKHMTLQESKEKRQTRYGTQANKKSKNL